LAVTGVLTFIKWLWHGSIPFNTKKYNFTGMNIYLPICPFAQDVPTIWDLVNHFSWGSLWGVNHPIKHTKTYGKDGGFQLVMGIPKSLDA
jgi:hypothetical protein